MVISRTCHGHKQDGVACGAAPLQDGDFCYMHSPEHAEEAAAARRTGGLRRRRESAIAVTYDFDGLDTIPKMLRVLDIVALDALSLENTPARGRLLLAAVMTAAKLREVGDHEERLSDVESVLEPRLRELKGR